MVPSISERKILTLLPQPELLRQLKEVVGDTASLYKASHLEDVQRIATDGMPLSGAILDAMDLAGEPTLPVLDFLSTRLPQVPVLIYTSLSPNTMRLVMRMARAGVSHVVLHRFDDKPERFRQLLEQLGFLTTPAGAPIVDNQIILVGNVISAALIRRLANAPSEMYDLTPRAFELLIAELLSQQGFDVSTTASTRDGGKDIIVQCRTPIGQQTYYVECKRYSPQNRVGVSIVRELYGVIKADRISGGIIATTSYFTKDALAFQEKVPFHLALEDKDGISSWLRDAASRNAY